jgi:outer membrane lipoprotein-sorting protein
MKFIASLLVFLSLSPASLSAQSHNEAKQLLEKAAAELKSHPQVLLEFDYNFENQRVDPPVVQNESGKIAVKGDDYRLEIMGMEQLRSGNKLYTILHDDEEVQVTEYDEEENSGLTPTSILESFRSGYSYKLGGSEQIDDLTIRYVILKPRASEDSAKTMVGIEDGSNRLRSLKQWGTNGTVTTFTITSYVTGKDLPPAYFQFDKSKYTGYYIAD